MTQSVINIANHFLLVYILPWLAYSQEYFNKKLKNELFILTCLQINKSPVSGGQNVVQFLSALEWSKYICEISDLVCYTNPVRSV